MIIKTLLLSAIILGNLMTSSPKMDYQSLNNTNMNNYFDNSTKEDLDEFLDTPIETKEIHVKKKIEFKPKNSINQNYTFFINHDGPTIEANQLVTMKLLNTETNDKVDYEIVQLGDNFAVMFFEKNNSFKNQEEFNRYLNKEILGKYSKFEVKISDSYYTTNKLSANIIGNKSNYSATNMKGMVTPLKPAGKMDLNSDNVVSDVLSDNKTVNFVFKNNNTELENPSLLVYFLVNEETGLVVGDNEEKQVIIKPGQETYSLTYKNLEPSTNYSLTYYTSLLGNENRFSEVSTLDFTTIKH